MPAAKSFDHLSERNLPTHHTDINRKSEIIWYFNINKFDLISPHIITLKFLMNVLRNQPTLLISVSRLLSYDDGHHGRHLQLKMTSQLLFYLRCYASLTT